MARRVGWLYDERFLEHDTGPGHPERPQRLSAVCEALRESGPVDRLIRVAFDAAGPDTAETVHTPAYVRAAGAAWGEGVRLLDGSDTAISERSYDTALLALGAGCAAVDAVWAGEVDRALVTARPPGHHAEADRAMGFCIFNTIAVAAQRLIGSHGLDRVAIVDFDVHHGNGTQHIFEDRADVLFISIHQDPRTLYPGTGFAGETGRGPGEGFTLNVPMMPGSGDAAYERAFDELIIPKLDAYEPRFLLISAGFDAAREDPLAQIDLTPRAFHGMTARLVESADRHCGGRVVSLLEGGYDLAALGRCLVAHTRALLDGPFDT